MELKQGGTIKISGCSVRFTEYGTWAVFQSGAFLGYADTLGEVNGLIQRHRQQVRDRLAAVEAEAERRKAEHP